MSQNIQIRRGTKEQLINYGSMELAELGFCTDTGEVYVGTGSDNVLVGNTLKGTLDSRPGASTNGRFYYVTTGQNAGYLYFDDGTTWHRINAQSLSDLSGNLDNVADGTAYKRVAAEDVTDGHVNKLSDGASTVTAAGIKGHMDDVAIHRQINDIGSSTIDLWSAQKIKSEIFNAIRGMDWQDSVKSKEMSSPPESPALHDRYLVPSGATGAWADKAGQIADWNGSGWDFYTPATGWSVYVEDVNKNFTYNISGVWVPTGGANQTIEAGSGLIGGGSYDNVILDVGAGNGIEVTADAVAVKAYKGIIADADGVSANIDNFSIKFDSANGNRLAVANIDGGTFVR